MVVEVVDLVGVKLGGYDTTTRKNIGANQYTMASRKKVYFVLRPDSFPLHTQPTRAAIRFGATMEFSCGTRR